MEDSKKIRKQLTAIIGVILAMTLIPLWGEYIYNGGSIPKDFFYFPPTSVPEKAGFSLPIFIAICIGALIGITLYVYPWIFGFKRPPKTEKTTTAKVKLPMWFWLGLFLFASVSFIEWGHFKRPLLIVDFSVIPQFWGFALMLDGIVYKRRGGESIINDMPRTLLGIGLASISGWLIFEYLNFFVHDNWCYPKAELIQPSAFYVYALIGSAGLMPMTIEVYSLFTTFKKLNHRYSFGPKIVIPRKLQIALLVVVLLASFPISWYPNQLFFVIWFIPLIAMALLLDILGIWTPFKPIAEKGDWTPLALICMAQFFMGFLHESWNYLSASHNPFETYNPDYWIYSIPYVDVFHIFEMPALGFFGYIPFGAYFWVWWMLVAHVFNMPPYFGKDKSYTGIPKI